MEKVLIVDGSSLLFHLFYGYLRDYSFIDKTDEEITKYYDSIATKDMNGKYNYIATIFMNKLYKLVIQGSYDYLAICWDMLGESDLIRKQIYPKYKANRERTPSVLVEEFQTICDTLDSLGIQQFGDYQYEADDMCYALVQNFKKCANMHIDVLTGDKDYFQMCEENVHILLLTKEKKIDEYVANYNIKKEFNKIFRFTPSLVKAIYGLRPNQIVDWKIIGGDASDNIKGIKGISSETAIKLLQFYDSIEAIYKDIAEEPQKFIAQAWKKYFHIGNANSVIDALRFHRDDIDSLEKIIRLNYEMKPQKISSFEVKNLIGYFNEEER